MKRLTVGLAGIGMLASGAIADGLPAPTAVPAGIGIDWEVGARFWYSTGHYKKDLFDSNQHSGRSWARSFLMEATWASIGGFAYSLGRGIQL
jgi:hypothetical protein